MELRKFVELSNPKIIEAFDAWSSIGFKLRPGQKVVTLRAGFSGYRGRLCEYIGDVDPETSSYSHHYHTFGKVGENKVKWLVPPTERDLFTMVMPVVEERE